MSGFRKETSFFRDGVDLGSAFEVSNILAEDASGGGTVPESGFHLI